MENHSTRFCESKRILIIFTARWVMAFFLMALTSISYAESCKAVGGCVGNIWYVHIPKAQFESRKIFTKAGLPKVNEIVAVSTDVSLLISYTFFRKPFVEELQHDLKATVEKNDVLNNWGWKLETSSKVRILSYRTFPVLGDMGNELFALVQVISE